MKHRIMTVALVVKDIKKSIEFYKVKLGLKVKTEMDSFVDFEMEGTHIALLTENLANDLAGSNLSSSKDVASKLILAWEAVENVDDLYLSLKSKGVEFTSEPKLMPWGQKVAYFKDPDGNLWEISQFS
ncbi:MAG TPA: VOC family protein [Saprospiraceae bacterium]|nr:VOC family protein [Saprospiraceae bacterium]